MTPDAGLKLTPSTSKPSEEDAQPHDDDDDKLNHSSLKSLFARMGKALPSETAARACVAKLASQKEEQVQEFLRDKKIFLFVDEAEVAKQKHISVLVGSLDAPNQTFLVNCYPLDSGRNVNSSIMTYCDNLK